MQPPRFPNQDPPSEIRAVAVVVALVAGVVAFAAAGLYLLGVW